MTQNLLEPLTATLETVRHRLTQHQQVLSENKTRTRRSLIGDESIRVWSAHAKFSLLIGGEVGRPQTPLNSLITPATRHSDFTYYLLRYLRAHPEHREDIRVVRVTRNEAAARLKVSKSTLDRMIKRGELTTETEQHGQRHTVWVLMDDDIEDTAEVSTDNINRHSPEFSEHIEDDIGTKNLALQAEVKGLRELVDLYRERLTDSDWRYQELMEQFKTMPKALPMAPEEHPRPKRRWWHFR